MNQTINSCFFCVFFSIRGQRGGKEWGTGKHSDWGPQNLIQINFWATSPTIVLWMFPPSSSPEWHRDKVLWHTFNVSTGRKEWTNKFSTGMHICGCVCAVQCVWCMPGKLIFLQTRTLFVDEETPRVLQFSHRGRFKWLGTHPLYALACTWPSQQSTRPFPGSISVKFRQNKVYRLSQPITQWNN